MKIVIVGAGAIGCWIGAQLAREGHAVTLVGRPALVQAIAQQGLTVNFIDGSAWRITDIRAPIRAATTLSPDVLHGVGAIVLCMKTFAVAEAIAQLQPFAVQIGDAQIIGFQNGYGTDEMLVEAFPANPIIAATTTTPVSIEGPAVIRIERMDGGIGVAPVANVTAQQLSEVFTHATRYADSRAMRWSKLLLNCIGNASGAILDLPPAQLFADKRLFKFEMRMLREILAVMQAMKIEVVDLPGYPARSLARAVRLLPNALLQLLLAKRFARGRGYKRPSFYYDVAEDSRTGRSEVEWLNGAVAKSGAQVGVPTPVNTALTQTLMALVTGQAQPEDWRGEAGIRNLVIGSLGH